MRRRTFLAAAGALFSAGCSEIIPPPRTTVTDDTTVPDNGTTTGPRDTSVPTTEQPVEPTDQPEETTDHAEQTETATPTQAEREAAAAIADARGHLSTSLDAYTAFADESDPTLLDVTAATDVTVSSVTGPASEARSVLDTVPAGASAEQQEAVDRLYGVADFLSHGIWCQANLYSAYSKFTFILGRIYAEDFATLPDERSTLRGKRDDAAENLQELRSQSDATDVLAFDAISQPTYEQKVSQIQREVTAFGALADATGTIRSGMDDFDRANNVYINENYRSARDQYANAAQYLHTANDTLTALETPASLATEISELRSVTNALATGCGNLRDAAAAADQFDWETHDAELANGIEQFRTSQVAVDEFETVTEIVDYYERRY